MEDNQKPILLVTGSDGQLGQEFRLLQKSYPGFEFHFASKIDFDVTLESRVVDTVGKIRPAAIINCAAYTNVEKAEDDREGAAMVNVNAVQYLAEACRENNVLLVHFSTDYVFDGKKTTAYTESDAVNPLNYYGESKLLGEKVMDEMLDRYFIFRTSWLYSTFGHNFYRTMLRLAKEHGKLKVVHDQVASPTYAGSLAKDTMDLMVKSILKTEHCEYGLYHYSENGEASWYDFANAIMQEHGMDIPVSAVSSSEFPTRAARPVYSKLDNSKFASLIGRTNHTWQEGLKRCHSRDKK